MRTVKRISPGRFLVAGHDRNRFFVARIYGSGRLDETFGNKKSPGRSIANFGGKECVCVVGGVMATNSKGKIIQAGSSSFPEKGQTSVALVRYDANGLIDRSFGKNGFAYAISKPFVRVTSIAVQRNGKILVGAKVRDDFLSKFALFRFMPGGKLDKSFFNNGRYVERIGDRSTAEQIVLDSRGRAVVAGGSGQGDAVSFVVKRFLLNR
ncbi:MAG: hypothetical protein ACSLFI_10355 [Solirubrobacterales bacterium]